MRRFETIARFEQEKDCCDAESEYAQYLTVETHDGGGGPFLVIRTDRWAINDAAELVAVLESVLASVGTTEPTTD